MMGCLHINFDKAINNVCPIQLDNKQVGDITINKDKDRKTMIVFDIFINPEFRGRGYFTEVIKMVKDIGRKESLEFIIAQWIVPEKIEFYLKRGFREMTESEQKRFCIQ